MTRWILALAALTLLSTFAAAQRSTNPTTSRIKPSSTLIAQPRRIDTRWQGPRLAARPVLAQLPQRDMGDVPPTFEGSFVVGAFNFTATQASIAVGPDNIVVLQNGLAKIMSRLGEFLYFDYASVFFGYSWTYATSYTDPSVFYDADNGRFVCMFESTGNGSGVRTLHIAVSDDSDPLGVWDTYEFPVEMQVDSWLNKMRFPTMGSSDDLVVVAGNLLRTPANIWNGTMFVALKKEELYGGGPATATTFRDAVPLNTHMARSVGSSSDTAFGATRIDDDTTRFYGMRLESGNPTLYSTDIDVDLVGPSPDTVQSTNGTTLPTSGSIVTSAEFAFDSLYLAYNCPSGATMVGSHWAEYDMGSWPQSGTVLQVQSGSSIDPSDNQYMPAIAANKHGDVTMSFRRSSQNIRLDAAAVGRSFDDPNGTMSSIVVLGSSPSGNWGGPFGGRFYNIALDPRDNETFWGTIELIETNVGSNPAYVASWHVSKTNMALPTTYQWTIGSPSTGDINSLVADDGNYLSAFASPIQSRTDPAVQLVVEGTAPDGNVLNFDFSLVAKASSSGLLQKIELWDWNAGAYVLVGSQSATMTDSLHSVSGTGDLSRFVQAGSRTVRTRVSWSMSGPVFMWPWKASVDQALWQIRVR